MTENYSDEEEIDRILGIVDKMCWECHGTGDWTPIDKLLQEVSLGDTKIVHLISWLTATLPCKTQLPYRTEFYKQTYWRVLLEHDTHPDKLLQGLE